MTFIFNNWYPLFSFVVLIFFGIFYFALRLKTKRFRAYQMRLRLFRIRDQLRMKIFEGKLHEESRVYQHYDSILNTVLSDTERLNAYSLAIALMKHGKEFDHTNSSQILKLVRRSDPEVQALIKEFYAEVASLFIRQSKFLVSIAYTVRFFERCFAFSPKLAVSKKLEIVADLRDRSSELSHSFC